MFNIINNIVIVIFVRKSFSVVDTSRIYCLQSATKKYLFSGFLSIQPKICIWARTLNKIFFKKENYDSFLINLKKGRTRIVISRIVL